MRRVIACIPHVCACGCESTDRLTCAVCGSNVVQLALRCWAVQPLPVQTPAAELAAAVYNPWLLMPRHDGHTHASCCDTCYRAEAAGGPAPLEQCTAVGLVACWVYSKGVLWAYNPATQMLQSRVSMKARNHGRRLQQPENRQLHTKCWMGRLGQRQRRVLEWKIHV